MLLAVGVGGSGRCTYSARQVGAEPMRGKRVAMQAKGGQAHDELIECRRVGSRPVGAVGVPEGGREVVRRAGLALSVAAGGGEEERTSARAGA